MEIRNTKIPLKGMTGEVFNAVIAVAKAHGLDWLYPEQNVSYIFHIKSDYIFIQDAIISGSDSSAYGKEISVEDFLFSLAPDWATDIIVSKNNILYYKGTNKCVSLKGNEYDTNIEEVCKVIASRKQKEKWQPKVGDEVYVNKPTKSFVVIGLSTMGSVVVESVDDGELKRFHAKDLKPLPPEPTEEKNLLKEMTEEIRAASNGIFGSIQQETCEMLIKAGTVKLSRLIMINY